MLRKQSNFRYENSLVFLCMGAWSIMATHSLNLGRCA
nr:MAG TPA: hypothetical protein [Caudoviricetes sp.]